MHNAIVRELPRLAAVVGLAIGTASCGVMRSPPAAPPPASTVTPTAAREPVATAKPKPTPPASPMASDASGRVVLRAATQAKGPKIMVSLKDRWLWFVEGQDTVVSAPVAVGKSENFEYNGRTFRFTTPVGRRRVLKKEETPIWTVPDWHYMEKAASRDLQLVRLGANSKVKLADGTTLEVRGQDVGRVNQFGNFWAFTPGTEIVFDDKIFMPPITSRQRRVPDALGPYKLDTGEGYLIHGTHLYNTESVGQAVSHGCVRMDNTDLERLYQLVQTGTPVFIF